MNWLSIMSLRMLTLYLTASGANTNDSVHTFKASWEPKSHPRFEMSFWPSLEWHWMYNCYFTCLHPRAAATQKSLSFTCGNLDVSP